MEDKRKNLRRHIKAASDWLEQADKSIEREEDLKGNLKLMLAKAELKNAEKHNKRPIFTKILSFITAAIVALGILWINDDADNISQLSTPSISTVNVPDSPILDLEENSSSTIAESPVNNVIEAVKMEEQIQNIYEQPQIYEKEEPDKINSESEVDWQSQESNFNTTYQIPNSESEMKSFDENLSIDLEPTPNLNTSDISLAAKAPTEDMQKLMQSAGQILRAE